MCDAWARDQRGSPGHERPCCGDPSRAEGSALPQAQEHLQPGHASRRPHPCDQFPNGPFDPPGTAEIPGLRPNLYGRFTINLGVWLPGLIEQGSQAPAQHSTRFINDYNCHLRARIGELLSEAADTWWRLSAPADQLAAIVSSVITGHALPWLARFSTWDDRSGSLRPPPQTRTGSCHRPGSPP
jgi:hypothetical protein